MREKFRSGLERLGITRQSSRGETPPQDSPLLNQLATHIGARRSVIHVDYSYYQNDILAISHVSYAQMLMDLSTLSDTDPITLQAITGQRSFKILCGSAIYLPSYVITDGDLTNARSMDDSDIDDSATYVAWVSAGSRLHPHPETYHLQTTRLAPDLHRSLRQLKIPNINIQAKYVRSKFWP